MTETTGLEEKWGRFTARGGEAVEAEIRAIVRQVGQTVAGALDADDYRTLVLLGGYGRGEGGVETVDGVERPHNNLDFLLVAADRAQVRLAELKQRLDALLVPLGKERDIGIDLGVITESRLRRSPCLVMWYDMRFGHKAVAGDGDLVRGLERFRLDKVLPWDVRNLLVNRGTLFLFNDLLLDGGELDLERRRMIVKHAVKGVIGYGDALLYFLGDYDWSYAEKQRRMRRRTDVPEAFRMLYDEAIEFRFTPCYDAYLERDPAEWMAQWRRDLAAVHLQCEALRLGVPALRWEEYPEAALRAVWREGGLSPRAWAKKGRNVLRSAAPPPGWGGLAGLGYRASGEQGLFPLVFPAIAYSVQDSRYLALAQAVTGAADTSGPELRRAYMQLWGRVSDVNFPHVLRRLGISLEAEGVPA